MSVSLKVVPCRGAMWPEVLLDEVEVWVLQPGTEELHVADMPDPAVAAARVVGDFSDGARERFHQRPRSVQVRGFPRLISGSGVSKDAVEVDHRRRAVGRRQERGAQAEGGSPAPNCRHRV